MITAMDIAFYAATACYGVAALLAARYLWNGDARSLRWASRVLVVGALGLVATFLLRWGAWRLVPLTTLSDSLNLLILQVTVIVLIVARKDDVRALLCLCTPPLAVLAVVNAAVAGDNLHTAPRALSGFPLVGHVGLAFLAYALFLVASMTSVAYVIQDERLKRRRTAGLFQRLPALERLDGILFRVIGCGYVCFLITIVLGGLWARADSGLLAPHWWLAPKIILSFVMAVFYAVAFHARRSGRLRGPKLAYAVFLGFSILLVSYVALSMMDLNTYNFWESSP